MSEYPSSQNAVPADDLCDAIVLLRRNLRLLRGALIQGDLETASTSFAAMRMIAASAPEGGSMSPGAVDAGANAFVALYKALEHGNLSEARKAFLAITRALQEEPPVRSRHRPPGRNAVTQRQGAMDRDARVFSRRMWNS